MIRPWYRSRLFWLGLPGLLFLLWAWGSSNLRSTSFFLSPSRRSVARWEVTSSSGVLRLLLKRSDSEPGPDWDPLGRFTIQSAAVGPEARGWFPGRPFYLRDTYIEEPIKTHYHFSWYSYWFLLLLYALPWAGWIAFRQRRKRWRQQPVES